VFCFRKTELLKTLFSSEFDSNFSQNKQKVFPSNIYDIFIRILSVVNEILGEKNHNFISNKSLESVTKFKYFAMRIRNQNCTHEEMKSR
jgi:hypothetical protein